jgi:hypothetical protein
LDTTTAKLAKIAKSMDHLGVVPVYIARRVYMELPWKLAEELRSESKVGAFRNGRFVFPQYYVISMRWSVFVVDTMAEPGVTHVYYLGTERDDDVFITGTVSKLTRFVSEIVSIPENVRTHRFTTKVEDDTIFNSALVAFFYMRSWGLERNEVLTHVTSVDLAHLQACFEGHAL